MEAICTTPRLRAALPLLAAAALGVGLSGCSIIFPPGDDEGCTSLEDVCPDLECEAGFVVNADGCAQCECATPEPEPHPVGCTSDADCAADEMCVFGGGSTPGEPRDAGPAPTEPAPPPCDPATGENCELDEPDEDRACEPNPDGTCGGGGEEQPDDPPTGGAVAEEGVCLPIGCPAIGIACPAGTHVEHDFTADPCGDPRCVPDDEPPPPPPPSECSFDGDCPDGLKCEIVDECGSMCDPSSNEPCPDVCVVIGRCVDPDPPPPPPGCSDDGDCGAGYLCEQTEVCACSGGEAPPEGDPLPPEDGGSAGAPCFQECHLEGQCVWNPDNQTCFGDGDCGEGQTCQLLDSCVAPPDCPDCLIACQGVCVEDEPEPTACMSDEECSDDEVCDLINYCEAAPGCEEGMGCLPVCYGRCVAPEPPSSDKCLEQADCDEGFRCASEVDSCYCPDGDTCEVCYWQCVPEEETP